MEPFLSIFFINRASVQNFFLAVNPILFPGRDSGYLDDSRAKTIISRLRSLVGTGTAMVPCSLLIWGSGAGVPRRTGRG